MNYLVKIRRTGKFTGQVRPEAEKIDGKIYNFRSGWKLTEEDHSLYVGESAMIPNDSDYPVSAPTWIPTGDLVPIVNRGENMKQVRCLIDGLCILIKYDDNLSVGSEEDGLFNCGDQFMSQKMSIDDCVRMYELNWYESDGYWCLS